MKIYNRNARNKFIRRKLTKKICFFSLVLYQRWRGNEEWEWTKKRTRCAFFWRRYTTCIIRLGTNLIYSAPDMTISARDARIRLNKDRMDRRMTTNTKKKSAQHKTHRDVMYKYMNACTCMHRRHVYECAILLLLRSSLDGVSEQASLHWKL